MKKIDKKLRRLDACFRREDRRHRGHSVDRHPCLSGLPRRAPHSLALDSDTDSNQADDDDDDDDECDIWDADYPKVSLIACCSVCAGGWVVCSSNWLCTGDHVSSLAMVMNLANEVWVHISTKT